VCGAAWVTEVPSLISWRSTTSSAGPVTRGRPICFLPGSIVPAAWRRRGRDPLGLPLGAQLELGPKPALLTAVFDVSVADDDDPVTLEEREVIKRLQADDDGARIIAAYGTFLAKTQARVVPISLLARQAAVADPEAASVWEQMNAERLTGMTHFTDDLHHRRLLRKGMSARKARDIL
jgi:hypothetical protein